MTQSGSIRYSLSLVPILLASVCVPRALGNGPDVIKASHHDVSPPLSRLAIGASPKSGGNDTQSLTARPTGPLLANSKSDPVPPPVAGPLTTPPLPHYS